MWGHGYTEGKGDLAIVMEMVGVVILRVRGDLAVLRECGTCLY